MGVRGVGARISTAFRETSEERPLEDFKDLIWMFASVGTFPTICLSNAPSLAIACL
jgi:hypothetical protein